MKYLGKIRKYFSSRGFGFIQSFSSDEIINRESVIKINEDIYFQFKDCSLKNVEKIDWVTFELLDQKGKIKAINIKGIDLISEIDHLYNNWDNYNPKLKNRILVDLESYFSDPEASFISYQDEESIYNRRFERILNSDKRKKIIDAAKNIINRPDSYNKKESLHKFLTSILERAVIQEMSFTQGCKDIIDKIILREFQNKYIEIENEMSKIPSREELLPSVLDFLENLIPSIRHTHVDEEGYEYTCYKWDGSEDKYNPGTSYDNISCKLQNPSFRGIINWSDHIFPKLSYSRMDDKEIVLMVYTFLHNSQIFWNRLINAYANEVTIILKKFIENTCKSVLAEVEKYLITAFPSYGKRMYDWAEELVIKKNYFVDPNALKNFILNTKGWDNQIENDIKYAFRGYHRPKIKGVNVIQLKSVFTEIFIYLFQYLATTLNNRSVPFKIKAFDTEVIYKNNMILSADEKILYSVKQEAYNFFVTIPQSVTHISDGAFKDCDHLIDITFLGAITHIGHDVFKNCPNIIGDFSQLSSMGYNYSGPKITINGLTRTISEWSYFFNKKIIDAQEVKREYITIPHHNH